MKRPYRNSIRLPGVVFAQMSCSAKLSPVELVDDGKSKRKRPVPMGPFCASTYVSIRATCPDTCSFKDNGCYAQTGTSRRIMKPLDEQAAASGSKHLPSLIAVNEASAMAGSFGGRRGGRVPQDGARGGRDLRLHVGGDAGFAAHVEYLEAEEERWRKRGGGTVWTYTHRWREIPADAWGGIAVWASCETPDDVREAHRRGYRASLVVPDKWTSPRMRKVDGLKVIPCPYETRGVTCVKCRLCLDAPLDPKVVIGFSAHGDAVEKARGAIKRRLPVVAA